MSIEGIINCCRSLDVPLEKIRAILDTKDNQMVLELLFEQREEAMRKSEYFRRIVEDVDWYFLQHRRIERTDVDARVEIKHCPKRYVLYGDDQEQTEAYHLKLQELINKVTASNRSIRRNYGLVLSRLSISLMAYL